MNAYFALGVLFLALGIVALIVIDSVIAGVVLVIGGALLMLQSWNNARVNSRRS